jgi:hypothetical protein
MPAPKNDITAEFVRCVFDYDAATGQLIWKTIPRSKRGGNSRAGKIAGNVFTNGYRYVKIKGRYYLVHRLIHLHQTGTWPAGKIDHASGNTLDNKKIREANDSQNGFNRGKQKNNRSGFKGVSWHEEGKRWRAQVVAYGKYRHLGLFKTKKEAHAAYCKAAKELHGEFANFG